MTAPAEGLTLQYFDISDDCEMEVPAVAPLSDVKVLSSYVAGVLGSASPIEVGVLAVDVVPRAATGARDGRPQ